MSIGAERVRERVTAWRDELINLSRNNGLIFFKHTKTSTLEIIHPSYPLILDRLGPVGEKLEVLSPA
jgi:hypothetical protein